jgi:hypothetical protein
VVAAVVSDDLTVVAAVRRDLAEVASVDPELARSGLAATALALAKQLDNPNSATSMSMCANALRDTLAALRERVPTQQAADGVSGLAERARLKLAGDASA